MHANTVVFVLRACHMSVWSVFLTFGLFYSCIYRRITRTDGVVFRRAEPYPFSCV